MRTTILTALLVTVLATPALAQSYPVSGKWGESTSSEKGPIDCTDNRRVIDFSGNQRTDSNGGVPTYWNRSVRVSVSRTIASSMCSATDRSATAKANTRYGRSIPIVS